MAEYRMPKPPALNWQTAVSADMEPIQTKAAALLHAPVTGYLKAAIIRDFFTMNCDSGMIGKRERDTCIAQYLKRHSPQPLSFANALEYLSFILYDKPPYMTAGDNLEILHQALDDVSRHKKGLNHIVVPGDRVFTAKEDLGTIGDVLSVGEENFSRVKAFYADQPNLAPDLQYFSNQLQSIAQETDKARERRPRQK